MAPQTKTKSFGKKPLPPCKKRNLSRRQHRLHFDISASFSLSTFRHVWSTLPYFSSSFVCTRAGRNPNCGRLALHANATKPFQSARIHKIIPQDLRALKCNQKTQQNEIVPEKGKLRNSSRITGTFEYTKTFKKQCKNMI